MPKQQTINIDDIHTDGDIQPREAINEDVVAEYAARMEDGDTFPPVVVYADGSDNWLADGYHRVMAATRNGWTSIDAEIRKGTRADAMWTAAAANKTHGLRTTPADRKRHVKQCLVARPESSNNSIAKHIGVSDHTVAKYRRELEATSQIAKLEKTVGSDGKARKAKLDKSDSARSFTCDDCGESFRAEVWHCPHCDHHHGMDRDQCNNCHEPRVPDDYEEVEGQTGTTTEIIDTTTGEVLKDAAVVTTKIEPVTGSNRLPPFKRASSTIVYASINTVDLDSTVDGFMHEVDHDVLKDLATKILERIGGAA